jgi:hypothetical protein
MAWEDKAFNEALLNLHTASAKTTGTYYIPVVVHVVVNSNIGTFNDSFVYKRINELNNKFANMPPNFAPDGYNMGIQFCLAQKDTAGNPTTGITYDSALVGNMYMYTYLQGLPVTYDVDSVLKKKYSWNPKYYLNMYFVTNALSNGSGLAGYAHYPSEHGKYRDGIVIDVDYINPADTIFYRADVIAHETGHYLGLYHTFDGGCTNANCLTDGDRVCDTPPDNYSASSDTQCVRNSCITDTVDASTNNPFRSKTLGGLGDQKDDARNYLDYTPCRARFTLGQKARMAAALTTTRKSLLDTVAGTCNISFVNVAQVQQDPTIIAPNPFTNTLTVSGTYGPFTFTLISLTGAVVYRAQCDAPYSRIELPGLPPATYLYVLKNEQGILQAGRIVKQ